MPTIEITHLHVWANEQVLQCHHHRWSGTKALPRSEVGNLDQSSESRTRQHSNSMGDGSLIAGMGVIFPGSPRETDMLYNRLHPTI